MATLPKDEAKATLPHSRPLTREENKQNQQQLTHLGLGAGSSAGPYDIALRMINAELPQHQSSCAQYAECWSLW